MVNIWIDGYINHISTIEHHRKVMLILESVKGGLDFLRQHCEVHCYICRNTFAASFRCISMQFSFSPNFAWTYHTISQYLGSKKMTLKMFPLFLGWVPLPTLHRKYGEIYGNSPGFLPVQSDSICTISFRVKNWVLEFGYTYIELYIYIYINIYIQNYI